MAVFVVGVEDNATPVLFFLDYCLSNRGWHPGDRLVVHLPLDLPAARCELFYATKSTAIRPVLEPKAIQLD